MTTTTDLENEEYITGQQNKPRVPDSQVYELVAPVLNFDPLVDLTQPHLDRYAAYAAANRFLRSRK